MFEIFGNWLDSLSVVGFIFFLLVFFAGFWAVAAIAFRAMVVAVRAFRAQILTRKLFRLRSRVIRLAARRVVKARPEGTDLLKEDPEWTRTLRKFWDEYLPLWYSLLGDPDPALQLDPDQVSRLLGAVEPPWFLLRNGAVSREHARKLQKHILHGRRLRAYESALLAWERGGYHGPRPKRPQGGNEVMELGDRGGGAYQVAYLVGFLSPSGLDRHYL